MRRYDHGVDTSSLSLRVAAVSLDCEDHEELARFYADLLAGTLNDGWGAGQVRDLRVGGEPGAAPPGHIATLGLLLRGGSGC
jgi:hypothetical protein